MSYPESPNGQHFPSDKHWCYLVTHGYCVIKNLNSNFRRFDPFPISHIP